MRCSLGDALTLTPRERREKDAPWRLMRGSSSTAPLRRGRDGMALMGKNEMWCALFFVAVTSKYRVTTCSCLALQVIWLTVLYILWFTMLPFGGVLYMQYNVPIHVTRFVGGTCFIRQIGILDSVVS